MSERRWSKPMWSLDAYQPGDELIYRQREAAPSERVLLIEREQKKRSPRVEVEFTEGERAGSRALVPGVRIYGLWRDVESFNAYMSGLGRIRSDDDLTDIESYAIDAVYRLLLPSAIGEVIWKPVHNATRVLDRAQLDGLVHTSLAELLAPFETLEDEGALLVSPNGSSVLAQALCQGRPAVVSDWVLEREALHRVWTKIGKPKGADGETRGTSAEWEWQMYRDIDRPIYALLRSWCGHRAITAHERRVAAEAEVRRLEVLTADVIDALRKGYPAQADYFEKALWEERITVEAIRPIVERPLDPSELPVRVEYRSRHWDS